MNLDPYLAGQLEGACKRYDVVGDLILVKIPTHREGERESIGRTLLEENPGARLVLQIVGGAAQDTRVRELRPIAGMGTTLTRHREYGATYVVDVSKVFFSPRLSFERWRVARQVQDGERVVNMFAGVGSFSILIARHRNAEVYSIDKNPAAVDCMRLGIGCNQLMGRVMPILGDAREICRNIHSVDRVLLPLPVISDENLPVASGMLGHQGIIHHYREAYGRRKECIPRSLAETEAVLHAIGGQGEWEILTSRVVRSVGAKRWHVVHDIRCQPPGEQTGPKANI